MTFRSSFEHNPIDPSNLLIINSLVYQILAKLMMNQLQNGVVPDCQKTDSIMTARTDRPSEN